MKPVAQRAQALFSASDVAGGSGREELDRGIAGHVEESEIASGRSQSTQRGVWLCLRMPDGSTILRLRSIMHLVPANAHQHQNRGDTDDLSRRAGS